MEWTSGRLSQIFFFFFLKNSFVISQGQFLQQQLKISQDGTLDISLLEKRREEAVLTTAVSVTSATDELLYRGLWSPL